MWKRFCEKRRPALRRFQQTELSGPAFTTPVLFYPFGGPDILTAATLFPRQQTYVLVGLEPPGSLPRPEAFQAASLDWYLPRLRLTLESLFRRSFFITANMNAQLRGQVADGVLPVLLVQLALLDAHIEGIQEVILTADGSAVGAVPSELPGQRSNRGVGIAFRTAEDPAQVRILFYLSANLNDAALPANRGFLRFLQQRQPFTTFFKSASYLPHRRDFSQIRSLVLTYSKAVFQDDTGIPYREIDPNKWEIRLYGSYSRPYGSFRNLVQPELRKAYAESRGVQSLDFYLGYGYGRAPSALLAFSHKN